MLTVSDIIVAIVIALAIRDVVVLGLEWLADTIENRRFVKQLDELIDDIAKSNAKKIHPAGRKRVVKKVAKRK